MLFHSLDFALFLPVVFLLYWALTSVSLKAQNAFIVLASYVFYGWWDMRFLGLLMLSTLVDYLLALRLEREGKKSIRKLLVAISLFVNLGLLGFFKYYNFFVESFTEAFSVLGVPIQSPSLNIILPVGISFYTFQTLSYVLDVYRQRMQASKDLLAFTAYVSFFPQLVAGPIERATRLLPQFSIQRTFVYGKAVDGLKQILWGLFKKVVIADNCAVVVNQIFEMNEPSGSTVLVGAFLFAFQIYGDFSGYSDIAIGTARLFGIDLMRNFAFPYFSRNVGEFWRRWHISLSAWFRDYVYIPLGGSRGLPWVTVRNVAVVFLLSGLWHGANWTFVAWGTLHALYFMPFLLLGRNRQHLDVVAQGRWLPSPVEMVQMVATFAMVMIAWIFFRAAHMSQAIDMISALFSPSFATVPDLLPLKILLLIFIMLLVEWMGREHAYALESISWRLSRPVRWCIYYALLIAIVYMGGREQQFIYFQF